MKAFHHAVSAAAWAANRGLLAACQAAGSAAWGRVNVGPTEHAPIATSPQPAREARDHAQPAARSRVAHPTEQGAKTGPDRQSGRFSVQNFSATKRRPFKLA